MKSFENDYVKCNININQNKLLISGNIKNASTYKNLAIMSPNPPDRISSHSGKNLPFPCD